MNNSKILAATATLLLCGSVFWAGSVYRTNVRLEQGLNDERLKTEATLSEKLALEKQIDKLKKDIIAYQGKNAAIDRQLAEASKKLNLKSAELQRMQNDYKSLTDLRKQYNELKQLKESLDSQVAQLNASMNKLQKENQELGSRVALLQKENGTLTEDLASARSAAINQGRVEATKKSEKLTVTAKRAKKLTASFKVPASIAGNLDFKIMNPDGRPLTASDGTIVSKVIDRPEDMSASLNATTFAGGTKEVQMIFEPKIKLAPGIYTIEVLNNKIPSGSLQVRLR